MTNDPSRSSHATNSTDFRTNVAQKRHTDEQTATMIGPSRSLLVGLAVLVAAIVWVEWPIWCVLERHWSENAQYSHGYLVPVFSIWLTWKRWGQNLSSIGSITPSRLATGCGFLSIALGLALAAAGQWFSVEWFAQISILPLAAGVVLLGGGFPWLRWSAPGIAFLVFMVPLPFTLESRTLGILQGWATIAAAFTLQTFGFVAFTEGNTIRMDGVRLDVLEACSGLRLMITLTALCTAVALVAEHRRWMDRILIVLAALPIALIVNVARVTVTGVLHQTLGHDAGEFFHEYLAVFLMMPLALGILWCVVRFWDLLLPELESPDSLHDEAVDPQTGT